MREVLLTRGKVALVDDVDFDRVNAIKWHARPDKKQWYAYNGKVFMHGFILNLPSGLQVDHRDGDGLNNTRNKHHGEFTRLNFPEVIG